MEAPAADTPTIHVIATNTKAPRILWDHETSPTETYRTERCSHRELNKAIRSLKAVAAKLGFERVRIVLNFA
jgi:hypothetical protein